MTSTPADIAQTGASVAGPSDAEILRHLEDLLSQSPFVSSARLSAFLRYVVCESLAGRAGLLKQYSIGLDVFDRESTFDPAADPIVRIQAGRVRRALAKFYADSAGENSVQISIPVGSYVPRFQYSGGTGVATHHVADAPARSSLKEPTIAVLPFIDQSYEKLPDYLLNGLLEELSGELTCFPSLKVMAYNSTIRLQGRDAPPVAQALEMGADYALHGTFRSAGNEMRITLHLYRTETGEKVWSRRELKQLEPGSKPLADYRMVRRLASEIADTFGVVQRLHMGRIGLQNRGSSDAFDAILAFHQYTLAITPANFARALGLLEEALQLEPDNSAVNAKLALLYLDAHVFGFPGVPANCHELGVRMARKARTLDPMSQQVHMTNAFAFLVQRDRQSVIRSAERIVEINPNAAFMKGAAGFYLAAAGEYERADRLFKESLELNPFYPTWFHFVPFVVAFARQEYAAALAEARQFAIPGFFWTHIVLASALAKAGNKDLAKDALARLLELRPEFPQQAESDIGVFTLDGAVAADILDGLHKAGLPPPGKSVVNG